MLLSLHMMKCLKVWIDLGMENIEFYFFHFLKNGLKVKLAARDTLKMKCMQFIPLAWNTALQEKIGKAWKRV
ncbi:hypothetical protein SDC9_175741 [bioreactor metagenome]|uniref:Uncharacterized protein n=1 Tax=bioreactor metagenome TaxID=1076179 RepID=A0A645GQ04_9ZZZZ